MLKHAHTARLAPFAALLLVFGALAANADTIYVCWDGSGDYLTIQEGIDAAQDLDEVVVCDGTYTGPGNKDLDFHGKAITVRSANGPENCIIDCEDDGRGFYFHSDEPAEAVLDGFTITNGNADTGGAIICHQSSPTITHCAIVENAAAVSAGGVHTSEGLATLVDCRFVGNSASGPGGAVFSDGSALTLIDCAFTGNSAENGGAVYSPSGDLAISKCSFAGNTAQDTGGGLLCWTSNPTVVDCTFTGNLANTGNGGGMWTRSATTVIVTNCTFSHNSAQFGGALVDWGSSDSVLLDCIFRDNFAEHDGGAVYVYQSDTSLLNCALIRNTATGISLGGGGGMLVVGWSSVKLMSCLLAGNSAPNGGAIRHLAHPLEQLTVTNCDVVRNTATYDGGGIMSIRSFLTLGNSIIRGNSDSGGADESAQIHLEEHASAAVDYCCVQGWTGNLGGIGNIDADPLFVDPENGDYRLSAGSPCIDAGCNGSVPPDFADLDDDGDTDEITPLDLDGEGRFFDDPNTPDTGCGCPPIVDMGAYEFGDTGPQPCPGDLDCDRVVGHSDLGILLAAWQSTGEGDLNCDGITDQTDLGILLAHWGEGCP